jgi:hypothetical protein
MARQSWRQVDSPATVVVLALVTVLIWLFAESQTLTRTEVETVVTVEAPEGLDRVARWSGGGSSVNVALSIEGPRSEIGAAAARLRREGVVVEVGSPGGPGLEPREYDVDLREAVALAAGEALGGVTVRAAEPARHTLVVEEVLTLDDVPVEFSEEGLDLSEPATIEPAAVRVKGPASALREVVEANEFRVKARIDRSTADSLRPGMSQRVEARLELPGLTPEQRSRVTISPSRANVRLAIRSRVSTAEVATAPVQILGLPSDLAQWRVTPAQRFVDGLRVTGPSDVISRIEGRELSVVAVVRLTSDELQRGIDKKEATYALLTEDGLEPVPASLTIEGPEGAIGLTIEEMAAVTAPADGETGGI